MGMASHLESEELVGLDWLLYLDLFAVLVGGLLLLLLLLNWLHLQKEGRMRTKRCMASFLAGLVVSLIQLWMACDA